MHAGDIESSKLPRQEFRSRGRDRKDIRRWEELELADEQSRWAWKNAVEP